MITLGVGKMEIDWGKNSFFNNHSALFQIDDVKLIPYYYVDDDEVPLVIKKEGLSKRLSSVKRRLDLLGYTLKEVERKYNQLLEDFMYHGVKNCLSYEKFSEILRQIDISIIDTPFLSIESYDNGYDLGEFVRSCIIPEKEIYNKLLAELDGDEYKVKYGLGEFFENIDPYIILRLLAENESCKDLNVYWSFCDVIEGGWANREDIICPLDIQQKILIVTEGSSDSFVLRKTIDTLYPDIADFFYFVDMQENYPFTGTGNLYNFCCGLMKIGVLNQIIVLFDNDTAGNEKYEKLMNLPQKKNLLIAKLPYVSEFENVNTIGPQGFSSENINGRAVAIECFLDFDVFTESPVVRWTNFVERVGEYQGALINKDDYVKKFKNANLLNGEYNISKLTLLVDYLLEQWCKSR